MSGSRTCRQDAHALVERLRNLHEGPLVLPDVVALGQSALPALENLLRGPSEAIYHARYLAADALAAISGRAATAALTRAMRDSISRALDPISLEAESVIVNRIADHLGRRPDPGAIEALLEALSRRPYPQCALALGRLAEPRAIPLLIECLSDDAARSAAVEALGRFDRAVVAPLSVALRNPLALNGRESPSRVDGRTAAARLLGRLAEGHIARAEIESVLGFALHDHQPAVRIEAALALVRMSSPALQAEVASSTVAQAASVLVAALGAENWARADTLMDALASVRGIAARLILPVIAGDCRDESDRVRQLRAVELAQRIGSHAALPPIASLRGATDPRLRLAAVQALDVLATSAVEPLARFLDDDDATIRRHSAAALRRRGALDAESAALLLGDSDWGVSQLAAQCLRDAGPAAVPALKHAVRGLGAPLRGVRSRWRRWSRAGWLLVCARRARPIRAL